MENLFNLLYRIDLGNRDLESKLEDLEQTHGDEVYAELVYLLSHLRFPTRQAKQHWLQVLAHREAMEDRFGAPVDLRVALVSYFVEVNRQLKNPKIIELKLFEQTRDSVYRDELTGLCNYRYFRESLGREIHRSVRHSNPISLVMIDIDNFKHYNDRNGHEAGNQVLTTIAGLLRESLREEDVSARYGGEEFALILPATVKTGAREVAERVRRKIEDHHFPFEESQPDGRVTASLGVATYPADAREADELVRRADSALYFAKSNGKNQIHLYGQNRRSYSRIEARLEGTYRALSEETHPLTTVNLSEGGILFLVDRNLPIGTLLRIQLKVPQARQDISLAGRVVRVESTETGIFQIAVRILEIPAADWLLLSRYIGDRGCKPDSVGPDSAPAGLPA
jgi:diguanylate cyclase (GGDEF)-like protein